MNDVLTRLLPPLALSVAAAAPPAAGTLPPGTGQDRAGGEEGEPGRAPLSFPVDSYVLPNGLQVVLHVDRSLPRVVVDTWVHVGSKDELPGRSGFAHLFEHLMFMGTERVPGKLFDVMMESGGASNNASTSTDRTNYFSTGPAWILPTLLWLDADRFASLDAAMTQEKLDAQRDVVRNERRQRIEVAPYGAATVLLPELLYPEGHPYRHPVIGSHEDLQAATVEDAVDFFRTYYVPNAMTLVVAGDFDPEHAKELVARTFGAIPRGTDPPRRSAGPVVLTGTVRAVEEDDVQFPKLHLVWHSPPYKAPGDGELDLVAEVLAGSPSSRLEQRLVHELGLAREVEAYQASRALGSTFVVEAVAAPGVELDAIEREVRGVLEELGREGPTGAELARVKANAEARFLTRIESLFVRADGMNEYLAYYGEPDGFERDLARWLAPGAGRVREVAARVFGAGHVDLRIVPRGTAEETGVLARAEVAPDESLLDERPEDLGPREFEPPVPRRLQLSNGIGLVVLPRPGTGLFAGGIVFGGGESAVPAEKAGLAQLVASVVESGAGGLDAAAFAQAVETLGADVSVSASRAATTAMVRGLASRLPETLDLFADLVLRPNLAEADVARERSLQLAAIRARADEPTAVAALAARGAVFPAGHPSGRPAEGWARTVEPLGPEDVREGWRRLLRPDRATLVFVGDFEPAGLRALLDERFGEWRAGPEERWRAPAPVVEPPEGRIYLVDRPGSAQTVLVGLRPAPAVEGGERAVRDAVEALFGRTFTSRLNQTLREEHGYTYGAFARFQQEGGQHLLVASSNVVREHTADALALLLAEHEALSGGDVTDAELEKARAVVRSRLVETAETTASLSGTYASLVADGRPLDAIRREILTLRAVDLDAANELARSGLFDPARLSIVLVGDAEAVLPQLEEKGLPAPTRLDEEGRRVD